MTAEARCISALDILSRWPEIIGEIELDVYSDGKKQLTCPECEERPRAQKKHKYALLDCKNGHLWAPTQNHCIEDEELEANKEVPWSFIPPEQRERARQVHLDRIKAFAERLLNACTSDPVSEEVKGKEETKDAAKESTKEQEQSQEKEKEPQQEQEEEPEKVKQTGKRKAEANKSKSKSKGKKAAKPAKKRKTQ